MCRYLESFKSTMFCQEYRLIIIISRNVLSRSQFFLTSKGFHDSWGLFLWLLYQPGTCESGLVPSFAKNLPIGYEDPNLYKYLPVYLPQP